MKNFGEHEREVLRCDAVPLALHAAMRAVRQRVADHLCRRAERNAGDRTATSIHV